MAAQRFRAALPTGYSPDNPEGLRRDPKGEFVKHADYVTLQHELAICMDALRGMTLIVEDSSGVSGYHLNGDIATWDEFEEVNAAYAALEEVSK